MLPPKAIVTECNFRNYVIGWLISKFTNASDTFQRYDNFSFLTSRSRPRSRSAIFAITLFNVKCQNIQLSATRFSASSYRFKDITILNIWHPKSWSSWRIVIFTITPFDGKCQNRWMSPAHFCASSYRLKDIKNFNFNHQKVGQGQEVHIFQLYPQWEISKSTNVSHTFLR